MVACREIHWNFYGYAKDARIDEIIAHYSGAIIYFVMTVLYNEIKGDYR